LAVTGIFLCDGGPDLSYGYPGVPPDGRIEHGSTAPRSKLCPPTADLSATGRSYFQMKPTRSPAGAAIKNLEIPPASKTRVGHGGKYPPARAFNTVSGEVLWADSFARPRTA
jgi:hypothetical protein